MQFFETLSKSEKRILVASLLLTAVAAAFIMGFDGLGPSQGTSRSNAPEVGLLKMSENDTRFRDQNSLVWSPTEQQQSIRVGDSVFAGPKSSAQVELKKGGEVLVGENSLVVFSEIKNATIPNLAQGNFRVQVKGEAKIAIRGQITTIQGNNSEVQISTDENHKATIKLVRGDAKVSTDENTAPVQLTINTPVVLPEPAPEAIAVQAAAPAIPTPENTKKDFSYNWKMTDVFTEENGNLKLKTLPTKLPTRVSVRWSDSEDSQGTSYLQASEDASMANPKAIEAKGNSYEFENLAFGKTYWRVSADGSHWSDAQVIETHAQYLQEATNIEIKSAKLIYVDKEVATDMTFNSKASSSNFIVQVSDSQSFDSENTHLAKSQGSYRTTFDHVGQYFVRARAINNSNEITNWSDAKMVQVSQPALLPAPKITSAEGEIDLGLSRRVRWNKVSGAQGYQVSILKPGAKEAEIVNEKDLYTRLTADKAGTWKVSVRAVDEWNRPGAEATTTMPVAKPPEREVASIEEKPAPQAPPALAAVPPADDPKKYGLEFWIWGGVGLSYSMMNQDVANIQKIDVAGFSTPSYMARTGFWASENVGLDLMYKDTPGKVSGSPGFDVKNGSYHWRTMGAEVLVRRGPPVEDQKSSLTGRIGVQMHQVPFIAANSMSELIVNEHAITSGSVGFEYRRHLISNLRFEWLMHYQFPLSSSGDAGTTYNVQSKLAFDGSVGAVYQLSKNLYLGAYWYGQWHSYKFDYKDSFVPEGYSGTHTLFHSTMDVRLGVEF